MDSDPDMDVNVHITHHTDARSERSHAAARRDAIARAMWDDYQSKKNQA